MTIIKNWFIENIPLNDFQAPELGVKRLCGEVHGHPSFPDGSFIHTSPIVDVKDMGTHKDVITGSGSRYSVFPEDVLPAAERDYPDYYNRLAMKEAK